MGRWRKFEWRRCNISCNGDRRLETASVARLTQLKRGRVEPLRSERERTRGRWHSWRWFGLTRFRLANFRLFRLIIVILYPCSMCPVLFYYLGNVYEGVILNSL